MSEQFEGENILDQEKEPKEELKERHQNWFQRHLESWIDKNPTTASYLAIGSSTVEGGVAALFIQSKFGDLVPDERVITVVPFLTILAGGFVLSRWITKKYDKGFFDEKIIGHD